MDSKFYKEIGEAVKVAQEKGASLTEQNLLYVVKVADDISKKTGADFDMLLGEGVIAMKKYEEKYDPTQNDSFVKGSAQAVRGYMMNAINRQGSLVHIPVNHLQGFKKGQEKRDSANLDFVQIDSSNYDRLGTEDSIAMSMDREEILMEGLNRLDYNGRTAMQMKLRLGKYSEIIKDESNPNRVVYKYKNNIQSIADELEVPVKIANKICKDAMAKLSMYCQAASKD